MSIRDARVSPGEYQMIGRFLDTNEEVFTRIGDLSMSASLADVAYRAMAEIGRLGPERYDFVVMTKGLDSGAIVVLTNSMLLQYVRTHWM